MAIKSDAWKNGLQSRLSAIEDEVGKGESSRIDDLGASLLPPLLLVQKTIAPAAIATLFSAPVVLVPGQVGKIILPDRFHIAKEVGSAWTTTGSGVLQLRWTAGSATLAAQFNQGVTDAFFGAAANLWCSPSVGGAGSAGALGYVQSSHLISGEGLALKLATADISGGSGNLIASIWYRVFGEVDPLA